MNIKIRFTVILFFLFFPLITEAEEVAKNQDTKVQVNSKFSPRMEVGAFVVAMDPLTFKDIYIMLNQGGQVSKNMDLYALIASLHFIRDGETYRISPNVFLATVAFASGFTGEKSQSSEILLKFWAAVFLALNPTLERFLWEEYIPVSISGGYNSDWFLFSPGRELYFKPHVDLNVMFKLGIWFKLTGSFAYLVTDTYDLKHGPRFEFRLGI